MKMMPTAFRSSRARCLRRGGVPVGGEAGTLCQSYAQPGTGADALQPPLRCGLRARLTTRVGPHMICFAGVDLTPPRSAKVCPSNGR